MELDKYLILFHYFLHQLGYEDFESLREKFRTKKPGTDSSGHTHFVNDLIGESGLKLDQQVLLEYDTAILDYEARLRRHRSELFLTLKYYQWFALLFTEYFLDRLSSNPKQFQHDLNAFKNGFRDYQNLPDYQSEDLKKIGFWMATGSGKTLLMHCNYWQFLKYFKDWENLILITPNEGLSEQHLESLHASGIPAKRYTGNEASLDTEEGEVLIIEITKLVKEKEGEGVSVSVDHFAEDRNLVFIDEGHKGQTGRSANEERRAWRVIKDHLVAGPNSFTCEYSATFGQIMSGRNDEVFQEYARAIIFDYSYRHFYADGYGKDFVVFNIDEKNEYNDEQQRLLMTASFLVFYEQLELYDRHQHDLREYNIERPLWIFVGSKVIGNSSSSLTKADKTNVSDVTRIIRFIRHILADPRKLEADTERILSEESNLLRESGEDIFKLHFQFIRQHNPSAEEMLQKVFHSIGQLEVRRIKQAEGEIGLKTTTSDSYFAVINIGDVAKYSKKLEEDLGGELTVEEENISGSLFQEVDTTRSGIHILIGSKKFIEGWNSWRVSSMGLMNMGRNEGAQIIQLFGRGVRLKGKDFTLKREDETAPYEVRALQTINIFGLNASYMNGFLENIAKETPQYRHYPVDIKFNREEEWKGKVVTFKSDDQYSFKDYMVTLACEEKILRRITVDLRNKVSVAAGGFNSQVAEDDRTYQDNFLYKYLDFLDFNRLQQELSGHALLHYPNLVIGREALREIIQQLPNQAFACHEGQFGIQEAVDGTLQKIAYNVLKDYVTKFYSDKEKDYLTRNLTFGYLDKEDYAGAFPDERQMIIKVPKERAEEIEKLLEEIQKFYQEDVDDIPTLHFDRHLYSPVAVWRKGKKYQDIKTVPVKLNQGETQFLEDLRGYLRTAYKQFENKEVYVLRNLSQKGVGFFIESSTFFPDFILWIVEGNKQRILFLDPKGIRYYGNFSEDKIVFCSSQIREINERIQQKLAEDKSELEVSLDAYILSVTGYDEIKRHWEDSTTTEEDFARHHVLFMDEEKEYLGRLFWGNNNK